MNIIKNADSLLPEQPPVSAHEQVNRGYYHEIIRYKLIRLAYNRGYLPIPEFNLPTKDRRRGRLDLAWLDKAGKLYAAIEIDFSYKPASYLKLKSSAAEKKWWIVVRKKGPLKQYPDVEIWQVNWKYSMSTKTKRPITGSTLA